ncbi:MAG: 1-acyl-sn-glycerol-3-phosphate acyltransferase, partial [Gemmatimonadales bacterium]|nr:1-acyl-sn-glycerol-3-phosphate acyltransferase [Gemmatimonadales bacterium]
MRRQAHRYFAGVHWARVAPMDGAVPTIFVANHSNWWDGFLAYLTTRALGLRFQIMMEARNLARYRAFLRVGAVPLRRTSARGAYEDLEAARRYVVPGAAMWIFPQGERSPASARPVNCERGVAHIALGMDRPVRICPVAFRYGYVGEQLPEAFVLVGEPWA